VQIAPISAVGVKILPIKLLVILVPLENICSTTEAASAQTHSDLTLQIQDLLYPRLNIAMIHAPCTIFQ
jgi:hypothetical protein